VAGNVDDVVNPPHDVEVAVFVKTPSVSGNVVAGSFGDVFQVALVVLPEGGQAAGRQGKFYDNGAFLSVGQTVAVRV